MEEKGAQPPPPEATAETIQNSIQSWKRLHWCRSKVNGALEVTSVMAMFALVSYELKL